MSIEIILHVFKNFALDVELNGNSTAVNRWVWIDVPLNEA